VRVVAWAEAYETKKTNRPRAVFTRRSLYRTSGGIVHRAPALL